MRAHARERDIGERDIGERDIGERDIGERHISERHIGERHIGQKDIGERDITERAIWENNIGERNIGNRDSRETVATCRFAEQLLIHIHIWGVCSCLSLSHSCHLCSRFFRHHKPQTLQSTEGISLRSSWFWARLRGL
jgi:hypothetical protein